MKSYPVFSSRYPSLSQSSEWAVKIPIILIFGVATTVDALRSILPSHALQCMSCHKFILGSLAERMDAIIEAVLVKQCSGFSVGHKVAVFSRNYFLRQDGMLTSFVRALKLGVLQVFPSSTGVVFSKIKFPDSEGGQNSSPGSWNGQTVRASNAGLTVMMDRLKMASDCFFAIWFVVGNVWIFGGHSSSSDAPNLYWLCVVFLTVSFIGSAMPFILCSMICCCFPCIVSILGVRDDLVRMRGASEQTIIALQTHKIKSKGKETHRSRDSASGVDDGGLVAASTERERIISEEDAVCCICLVKYADNDELKELPCYHFFHTKCLDKWLKINASCPLCKFEIGDSQGNS